MDTQTPEVKKPNHARNLCIIACVIVLGVVAFNAIGATQCLSRGGEITRDGLSLGCLLDFSRM